ncbi:MAG: DUF4331 domain-containing protein [Bryobacteraceae bacterium]|nr:DUF4331 domain-containing protein [Bryobacteraceae bacterium]
MRNLQQFFAAGLCLLLLAPAPLPAANHREAPITALDHKADITDVFAFVSYAPNQAPNTPPSRVTLILCVDPLLEPANGPNYFPFDTGILYEIKVDNDNDAVEDVVFQFQFQTEQRLGGLFTTVAGIGNNGAAAPANSPAPVAPGTAIVPPRITSFASAGLGQRQPYNVTMVRKGVYTALANNDGRPFYAVPANAGSRTMDYAALYQEGTYKLGSGINVFAGTVDDPFWIDLGATFDTINLRTLGSGVPAVLTDTEDAAKENFASDTVSGYAVNAIAVEVPIEMLTRTGRVEAATSPAATIGVWATTSRPRITIRRNLDGITTNGPLRQVQRMGNPLVNELLIGTGSKDRFSMDQPKNDSQFANFLLDPALPRVVNALTNGVVAIPAPPRTDLLPLVTYAAPIAATGTAAGPVADLLRLNTGVPATPEAMINRLGLLAGDAAGFPNGRRLQDDVTDIALRVAVGGVLAQGFNRFPNNRLGDGVNVNDTAYRNEFPYLGYCPDGRDRRHLDPGEPGGGPVR